jgi:hypothetical protein
MNDATHWAGHPKIVTKGDHPRSALIQAHRIGYSAGGFHKTATRNTAGKTA